ncbi:carboxypeptidase-like regulatory domain-containing protein [Marinifilum fragile]|uniref:carboxypeptidase-like regulatory domain-containing protein n=1 Tax=Marinifilum fragile TaxID=570161 RepID=UPI002AAAFE86|nr:carboxypeptidase-like regulatory domain-containing protein [Marinifilum fragile]
MHKRIRAKIESYMSIQNILNQDLNHFETDPSAKSQVQSFLQNFKRLESMFVKLNQPTEWITAENNKQFKLLVKNSQVLEIAINRLVADTNDMELFDKLNIHLRNIKRGIQLRRINSGYLLYNLCKKYQSQLEKYGTSQEFLQAYRQILLDIEDNILNRKKIKDQNERNRKEFNDLVAGINQFLKDKLDWTINSYQETHPELYFKYHSARKLKKSNSRHYSIRGSIVDKDTGQPISYGTVSVLENNLQAKITKNGNFNFMNFPEGEFTLKIENIRYHTSQQIIKRYSNEHLNLKIELQALPVAHPG